NIYFKVQIIPHSTCDWLDSGKSVATYLSFPYPKYCRCWYQKSRPACHLFDPVGPDFSFYRQNFYRGYSQLDIIAFKHPYQHFADFGFLYKTDEFTYSFFDTRMTGDILQRINDHRRIEQILTTSSLNVLFSMVNLVVFSFVLAYYSLQLFVIFLAGSFLYFLWITIFLKKIGRASCR